MKMIRYCALSKKVYFENERSCKTCQCCWLHVATCPSFLVTRECMRHPSIISCAVNFRCWFLSQTNTNVYLFQLVL
jgi:hypothetical protein